MVLKPRTNTDQKPYAEREAEWLEWCENTGMDDSVLELTDLRNGKLGIVNSFTDRDGEMIVWSALYPAGLLSLYASIVYEKPVHIPENDAKLIFEEIIVDKKMRRRFLNLLKMVSRKDKESMQVLRKVYYSKNDSIADVIAHLLSEQDGMQFLTVLKKTTQGDTLMKRINEVVNTIFGNKPKGNSQKNLDSAFVNGVITGAAKQIIEEWYDEGQTSLDDEVDTSSKYSDPDKAAKMITELLTEYELTDGSLMPLWFSLMAALNIQQKKEEREEKEEFEVFQKYNSIEEVLAKIEASINS